MKPRFRYIKAFFLATTIVATPALAHADPVSLVALVATAAGAGISGAIGGTLGAILGALVTAAITFAGQQLFGQQTVERQREGRTREFNPHPVFRFAFGEFPQDGSVIFHHTDSNHYYIAFLLNSIPSEAVDKIEIFDGIEIEWDDLSLAYDMSTEAKIVRESGTLWLPHTLLNIGLGEQTQPPQRWLDEIPDQIKATDTWKGATVAFIRFRYGGNQDRIPRRWGRGTPPALRFFGKWSKLYDPRKDPNSGVTQYTSGAHDPDDRTTWEYTSNPALAGLLLAFHDKALGRDQEIIPIQQWADAADACEVEDGGVSEADFFDEAWGGSAPTQQETTSGELGTFLVDPGSGVWQFNRGSVQLRTGTDDQLNGVPVCSLFSDDTDGTLDPAEYGRMGVYIDLTENDRRADIEYLLKRDGPLFAGADGVTKYRYRIYQADGGGDASTGTPAQDFLPIDAKNITLVYDRGDTTLGDGSSADTEHQITGKYVSFVVEGGEPNESDIEVGPLDWNTVNESGKQRFRCDGMVRIEDRELSLLDPVLDAMAGHLDTTGGLLGVRAGVWVAPTDSLTQPISDEVEVTGARDAGFDTVRSKFIGLHRDYQPTDGPGYTLRAGARVQPLELPLVSVPEQAARLEKIAALRAEPNRIVSAKWDGREAARRLGERVNLALPGMARAEGTYIIDSKELITQEVDDGFEVAVAMRLREDLESTYAWAAADYDEADATTAPTPGTRTIDPPTSVTLAQQDYLSAAGATARLKVTVEISSDLSSVAATLRVELSDGSGFTFLADIDVTEGTTSYSVFSGEVSVGVTYTARARARHPEIGGSDWVTSNSVTVVAPVLDYDHDDYGAEYA